MLILDDFGDPVFGATVSSTWSALVIGTDAAVTDGNGIAKLNSPKTRSSGCIDFTVTDVTKADWTYDPSANVESTDMICNPPAASARSWSGLSDQLVLQSYPNPFADRTQIQFYLKQSGEISLGIFDINGRLVRVLAEDHYTKGSYSVEWDGTDEQGHILSSGVYLCKLQAEDSTKVLKISLMR